MPAARPALTPAAIASIVAARVDTSGGPLACWPWTGGRDLDGYGRFGGGHRHFRAHRGAWESANGPIPHGLHVLHECDNPPCCNPLHLFLGSKADNNPDRARKGRTARRIGEANHNAKLTPSDVRAIRRRLPAETLISIGRSFGVSESLIWQIAHGRKYAHVL